MTGREFRRLLEQAVEEADELGLPSTHPAVLATTDEVREGDLKHPTRTPSGKTVGIVTVWMARRIVEGWVPTVADIGGAA